LATVDFLQVTGFGLILAGIIIVIVAMLLLSIRSSGREKGKIKAGGIVIIGPVPVVFGTDKKSLKTILILSIVLTLLLLAVIAVQFLLR
jgi:uncharacterized protein (TIGR00304 family)